MRLLRRSVLVACLVAVPSVAAQETAPESTIELAPNAAGKRSELRVDFRPSSEDSAAARDAQSIALAVQRGFRVDPRSRRARCSDAQAEEFACPEDSRIGAGRADGTASGAIIPGGSQSFSASIEVFLGPPRSANEAAGVIVQFHEPQSGQRGQARGSLVRLPTGPFAAELRFEGVGQSAPSFPGVTVSIDRVQLAVGARRKVIRTRFVRRDGRRVRVRRVRRYSLITNPSTCNGEWAYQVRIQYPDREDVRPGSLACTP